MKGILRVSLVFGILVVLLSMSGCLDRMDVSGDWVGFVVWDGGDSFEGDSTTIRLTLLQDRRSITGSIHFDADFMNLDMDIVSGEGSNSYITLETAGAASGNGSTYAIFVTVEGLVNGSRIEGTGTMTIDGAKHTFTWQAQRSS